VNINVNPESLLFVGQHGLFRVSTPFTVLCVTSTGIHDVGDYVRVYRVIEGDDEELLYLIRKEYISHHYFQYHK
jgi:hypothetical protein